MIYVGVPDKKLNIWLKGKEYMISSDEGEAIGICAGLYYATKERATAFMNADGFLNALNPITSFVIPYDIKMNIVVSYGRKEPQHKVATYLLPKILKSLKYDSKKISFKLIK
jgi:sulfopyruvate decarboxylase TPP-binding subunit